MSKRIRTRASRHLRLRRLLGLGLRQKVPDLALLANAEDERTGDATELFVFRKISGAFGEIRIDRDEAQFDPKTVARKIVAKNGVLPRDLDQATRRVKEASSVDPCEFWKEVRAEGWRDGRRSFIHNGRVIGQNCIGRVRLKPPTARSSRTFRLDRRGKIKNWQEVLRIARHSSRMRLGICAAFAAPLLSVVDLQSFMLVIAGRSKAGKSTVLLALASVIGIGREERLPNFNATGASLQETAAEFNDLALPVNEIGLLGGAKRDAYQSLRSLIYRYAEGRDTIRHTKSIYAAPLGAATWRGIMVASSESTIEALAELAGEKRDDGEYARAFDVPAVRDGNPTVFDTFPKRVSTKHREAWARQQLARVRELCATNHGRAFDRYIAYLIEHRTVLEVQTKRAMSDFIMELKGDVRSGAIQHAAHNFALLYAGGVMAKKAGILPWSLRKTQAALRSCFLDGLGEVARVERLEVLARQTIKEQLSKLRPITPSTDIQKIDGWYEDENGTRTYTVRTGRFRDWLSNCPEQERAALRWLHEGNFLILCEGKKPNFPHVEWAVKFYHHKLDGKDNKQRCYQFLYPFV